MLLQLLVMRLQKYQGKRTPAFPFPPWCSVLLLCHWQPIAELNFFFVMMQPPTKQVAPRAVQCTHIGETVKVRTAPAHAKAILTRRTHRRPKSKVSVALPTQPKHELMPVDCLPDSSWTVPSNNTNTSGGCIHNVTIRKST